MRHPHDEPYNENGLALGMFFAQAPFRLFTPGDLSATAEDAKGGEVPLEDLIAPSVDKCDVAKLTHHGYHSMTRGLLEALDARVIISPVWDQLHNTDDTLQRVVAHCVARGGLFLPTVFPKERREALRKIPSVIPTSCYEGVHVVITVPSDANAYYIETVRAKDESMIIDERFTFSQPR